MSLISASGLAIHLEGRVILRDVDFAIGEGEIVTVVGPNGSGKSTFMRALVGALSPAEGRVSRRAGLRIGYVPQSLHIDRTLPMTVGRFLSLPVRRGADEIGAALAGAGLPDTLSLQQITALSGGQFQRVLLARALMGDPHILVLDEPTTGLDQPAVAAFYLLIEQVRRRLNCAVLMVSHDLHVVMSASDRVICINGHICCEGAPTAVSEAPEYRALFGHGTKGALALYQHDHDHAHDHDHGHGGTGMIFDLLFFTALLAGLGVAVAAGPLGCFVVWRRMAYFGDATAHAAILGVALALALDLDGAIPLGVLVSAVVMAVAVTMLSDRGLAVDTLLGVAAHSALAFGVLAFALTGSRGAGLEAYLFGDILIVSRSGIAMIWCGAVAILLMLWWRWSALLTATVSEDLARAEGIHPVRERLILMLSVALLVAMAIEVVGALLVTALLIIPAATARPFARTPEGMAILAATLAVLATLLGLVAAFIWDVPAGPAIVAASAVGFGLSAIISAAKRIHIA